MANKLTPPPPTGIGILDRWLALLYRLLSAPGQLLKEQISDFAHNHTADNDGGALTNDLHDGYVEIATSAVPSTPAAGKMRIYAQDAAGVARLRALHSTGSDLAFFRDAVVRVKNTSGGTINKGEIVYCTGATGNFPTIAKAKANAAGTMPAIGMVLTTAVNNAFTTVQTAGEMTGLDTSAFAEGVSLFVSATTAGALTSTEPQHPFLSQEIGFCTKSNAGAGSVQLFCTPAHEGDDFGSNRNAFKIGDGASGAKVLSFVNAFAGSLSWNPTADRTLTLPDADDTLVGKATTDTLTNKTLTTPVLANPSFSGTTANMGTVTTIDINGGTVDGTAIGATTRSTVSCTTLNASGAVVLGTSSETALINGTLGVGGGATAATGVLCISAILAGAQQTAFRSQAAFTSSGTSDVGSFRSLPSLEAASFTCANAFGFVASNFGALSGGAAITNQHGVLISDQTRGVNNYGITLQISSGANKYNINATGTAQSVHAGLFRFGGVTAPVATVDVTGSVAATTTILSSGATSGIGYTIGAGGTVAQATSKATGVTLNKCTGLITTASDALAANTITQFTLTNSAIAATDIVDCCRQSGGTAMAYEIETDSVAAGSCVISIRNRTAGSLSEAIVIRFSITKGVSA